MGRTGNEKGRGGTFCQFRVGASGASAAHLGYISRESAVLDREAGVLLFRMPGALNEIQETENPYTRLRLSLIAHAWVREAAEPRTQSGKRDRRTHYRATLSFEKDVSTENALHLARAWLWDCIPLGQAAAFLHRNSAHVHLHIWIDARGTDGKKLDFSAREYRQLDERWNALYAPFVGRPEQEHLQKKQHGRKVRETTKGRIEWREWELKNAGGDELEKIRTRRDEPTPAASTPNRDGREHAPSRGEPARSRGEQALTRTLEERDRDSSEAARAVAEADRSVSETDRLREALTRLGGEREPKQESQRELKKESGLER